MKAIAIALLMLASVLAGCAEDAAPIEDPDADTFEDLEAQATDSTGLIRGLVLDPAIVPIAGVTVTIISSGVSTVTNENGAFVFSDLEPGTYFLEAAKLGYFPVQSGAEVEAGVENPPITKITLLEDAGSQPQVSTIAYDGFLQCSATLVVVSGNLCGLGEIFGVPLDNPLVVFTVEANMTWSQTEMIWDSTQPLGDRLNLQYSWEGGCTLYCDHGGSGPSPLTISADGETMAPIIASPAQPAEGNLMIRVFGTESTLVPDSGLGATLDQPFTHYTNLFYNFLPDNGWSYIEDGAHPIPQ